MLLKLKASSLSVVMFVALAVSFFSVNTNARIIEINTSEASSNEQYSKSIYLELLEIRRDLFEHPEESGKEKRTSNVVAKYLTNLGLEVKINIGGYGVVGILKGAKPGKSIAWRADMDGAKFEYDGQDDEDASHTGEVNDHVGHICGHDVHTTIGLGIANTLSRDIENLAGTVYFLFQPAEESQKGAKAMIHDGLFEIMQADEIYAAHVAPNPTGVITALEGNPFSHSRYLQIEFNGMSDEKKLSAIINSTISSLSRLKSPEKFTNLLNTSDAVLGLGSSETIYQNYIIFNAPVKARKKDNKLAYFFEFFASEYQDIDFVKQAVTQGILDSDFKDRLSSLELLHKREGVNNSPELVLQTSEFLKAAYGDSAMVDYFGKIPFASEDFGHFQKSIPGVYFFIGIANAEKGNVAFPHMRDFEVDEMVVQYGVSRFSSLIQHRLKQ